MTTKALDEANNLKRMFNCIFVLLDALRRSLTAKTNCFISYRDLYLEVGLAEKCNSYQMT